MPRYLVSIKEGTSEEEYASARKQLEEQGGKIEFDFSRTGVCPGFEVTFPQGSVSALESIPHVISVEQSHDFSTQ